MNKIISISWLDIELLRPISSRELDNIIDQNPSLLKGL